MKIREKESNYRLNNNATPNKVEIRKRSMSSPPADTERGLTPVDRATPNYIPPVDRATPTYIPMKRPLTTKTLDSKSGVSTRARLGDLAGNLFLTTTVHGVYRANASRKLRRFIWTVLVLGCVGGSIWQVTLAFQKFLTWPVDVKIKVVYDPQAVFPAVTFCNLNPMLKSNLPQLHEIVYGAKQEKKNGEEGPTIDSGTIDCDNMENGDVFFSVLSMKSGAESCLGETSKNRMRPPPKASASSIPNSGSGLEPGANTLAPPAGLPPPNGDGGEGKAIEGEPMPSGFPPPNNENTAPPNPDLQTPPSVPEDDKPPPSGTEKAAEGAPMPSALPANNENTAPPNPDSQTPPSLPEDDKPPPSGTEKVAEGVPMPSALPANSENTAPPNPDSQTPPSIPENEQIPPSGTDKAPEIDPVPPVEDPTAKPKEPLENSEIAHNEGQQATKEPPGEGAPIPPNEPGDEPETPNGFGGEPESPPNEGPTRWRKKRDTSESSEMYETESVQKQMQDQFDKMLFAMKSDTREQLGYDIDKTLVDCTFQGKVCDESNFTHFNHMQFGNCFTFNQKNRYGNSQSPTLQSVSKPGPTYGLSMELNINQSEYIAALVPSAGMRVIIHDPSKMPFPEDEGYNVSPGYHTSIAVKRTTIHRTPLPYGQTDCFNDSTASSSDLYRRSVYSENYNVAYSVQGCTKTCYQRHLVMRHNCVSFKAPREGQAICELTDCDTLPICNETDPGVKETELLFREGKLACEQCVQSCQDVIYENDVTSARWPANDYVDIFSQKLKNFAENNGIKLDQSLTDPKEREAVIRKNMIKLTVYFKELNYESIREEWSYQPLDLLSDIGGQFGLWAGISFLTLAEYFEFIMDVIKILLCGRRTRSNKINSK